MMKKAISKIVIFMLVISTLAIPKKLAAQTDNSSNSGIHIAHSYKILSDITYHTANNWEAKLDLYLPKEAETPPPVLINYHGGGWISGDRHAIALHLLPYLEKGFAVVNVSYRLAEVALAPAAVIDAVCAFRWVIQNSEQYNLDLKRIVLSGGSAGGHLALMAGLLPDNSPLTYECPVYSESERKLLKDVQAAAIVNWFGVTDVTDLLSEPNQRSYALRWIGGQVARDEIARSVSPINYVQVNSPPTITIHGNADSIVPYEQGVKIHQALDKLGIDNELITVNQGNHGNFTLSQQEDNYAAIWQFLKRQGVIKD